MEGRDQQVDVLLGGDQGWGQAHSLTVRLLGEDSLVEQLLAHVPTGAQFGADVDARPQAPQLEAPPSRSASQPSAGLRLQSPKPGRQQATAHMVGPLESRDDDG